MGHAVENPLVFLFAGNATFTLRDDAKRYTYKVTPIKNNCGYPVEDEFFLGLLTGPENDWDYSCIGTIKRNALAPTRRAEQHKQSFVFFEDFYLDLQEGKPTSTELWHAGRCARCGRTLTVPESIASGFGPECITKLD